MALKMVLQVLVQKASSMTTKNIFAARYLIDVVLAQIENGTDAEMLQESMGDKYKEMLPPGFGVVPMIEQLLDMIEQLQDGTTTLDEVMEQPGDAGGSGGDDDIANDLLGVK
jgi:hypothetical protein